MRITSCSASEEYGDVFSCEHAYDGNIHEPGWSTNGHNIGAWIKINFLRVFRLTKVMTMNREIPYVATNNFKNISLQFLDGNNVDFTLTDTDDRVWDIIDMVSNGNIIISSYVNITVLSIYGDYLEMRDGLTELRVYGCIVGMIMQRRI